MKFGTIVRFKKEHKQGYLTIDAGTKMAVAHYQHKYFLFLNSYGDMRPISDLIRIDYEKINDLLDVIKIPENTQTAIDAEQTKSLFGLGQIIKHIKSGGEYIVRGLPDKYRIESSNAPAYAYESLEDGVVWVRPQSEMEDGRFELITRSLKG